MTALAIADVEELSLTLDVPKNQTFDEWRALGERLFSAQRVTNWWIGDWWAAGQHRYGERAKAAAEGIFGRSFGGLANLASISRAFETSRRRELVSYNHHVEVAGLAPEVADKLLDRAENDQLSVMALRREVLRHKGLLPSNDDVAERRAASYSDYPRAEPVSRDIAKRVIYDRLVDAATKREICPNAEELAKVAGLSHERSTVAVMHLLEQDRMISVERFQRSRIVTILQTGETTATPNDTTPHWRQTSRDVPTPAMPLVQEKRPDVARLIMLEARDRNLPVSDFLVDLVIIGWSLWEERGIQAGASAGLVL